MAPHEFWGCFAPREAKGSGHQSWQVAGCSALGTEDGSPQGWGHSLVPMGMLPVERMVSLRLRPTGCVPGLAGATHWGTVRVTDCGEYGYQMVDVKKKKIKSPSGSSHQQFTAMTIVPVPSLGSSSPSIPRTLPTRSVTRFSWCCQSKQDLAVMLGALTSLPPPSAV